MTQAVTLAEGGLGVVTLPKLHTQASGRKEVPYVSILDQHTAKSSPAHYPVFIIIVIMANIYMYLPQHKAPGLLCLLLLPSTVPPDLPFPEVHQQGAQRSLERELVHMAEQTMSKQRAAEVALLLS